MPQDACVPLPLCQIAIAQMTDTDPFPPFNPDLPGHACQVLRADAVYVSQGVNQGDGLGGPDQVYPGDVYALDAAEQPRRLGVTQPQNGRQHVAFGSQIGTPGDALVIEARYALMTTDGDRVELLLVALPDGSRYALPLSPMAAGVDYTLLKIEEAPDQLTLSDFLCISFARGTVITLATGQQRAIEDLIPGDKVLTRDHGGQPIRWIGATTLRAVGAFAPVVISAGAMGNTGDLIVSQHHRMFLYQRSRTAGLPTAELFVQAKHLVDGAGIFLRAGGFVDYFSLVFDRHEIIYAEGVPAESLMVTDATVNRLPPDLAAEVKARFPGLSQHQHFGTEAGRAALGGILQPAPAKPQPRQNP